MQLLGVKVIFALSPQAKGKVERPYRWMQDRIVRICCLEKISDVDGARSVLYEELDRYNNHQVHSTTEEIPAIRFERAIPHQIGMHPARAVVFHTWMQQDAQALIGENSLQGS